MRVCARAHVVFIIVVCISVQVCMSVCVGVFVFCVCTHAMYYQDDPTLGSTCLVKMAQLSVKCECVYVYAVEIFNIT